jgi:hypothetical protein
LLSCFGVGGSEMNNVRVGNMPREEWQIARSVKYMLQRSCRSRRRSHKKHHGRITNGSVCVSNHVDPRDVLAQQVHQSLPMCTDTFSSCFLPIVGQWVVLGRHGMCPSQNAPLLTHSDKFYNKQNIILVNMI